MFGTYTKLHKIAAVLVVMIIIAAALIQGSLSASLSSYAESSYTDVLTDLQKDENFDTSEYPSSLTDYTLSVIQIAESEDNELFVYVYQPYNGTKYDLTATSINISTTTGDNLSYKNYSLSLLSESGALQKYKVNNFTVKSATVRYYDISSIYRTYYTAIDGEETGGNTTSELAIAVGQCWAVGELNGETYYDMEETKVVTIESYAGYIRYFDGLSLSFLSVDSSCIDSHFIAFSADMKIEELYEADISFYTVPVEYKYILYTGTVPPTYSESTTYGDIDTTYYDTPLTIERGNTVSYESIGWFGVFSKTTYSWDRICTVADFVDNLDDDDCEYDSDLIDSISDKQWVIRFYETEYEESNPAAVNQSITKITYTEVTDITILRLKFLSEGVVYNLGIVSNKVTGSSDPDGTVGIPGTGCEDATSTIKQILMLLAILLLIIIFWPFLPYVIQFVVWIISLPVKLVKSIVEAIKKSSNKNKKE